MESAGRQRSVRHLNRSSGLGYPIDCPIRVVWQALNANSTVIRNVIFLMFHLLKFIVTLLKQTKLSI